MAQSPKKRGLGRGLAALFDEGATESAVTGNQSADKPKTTDQQSWAKAWASSGLT